jgi:hypothetical protein
VGVLRFAPWAAGNNPGRPAETPRIGPVSRLSGRPAARPAVAAAVLCLAACGQGPEPVPEAPPYTDPGFVQAGEYRMDYALTMSSDLPSGIAGSYGIQQRRNLAVLAVTLAPGDALAAAPLDAPEIEAAAVALTGERTQLPLARHDAAGRPTWLASVEVRHRVPVTIEIRARATAAGPELRARLTREFRLE